MAIYVREMAKDEIEQGLRLSTLAGWNQTELDWAMILDASRGGSFCAVDAGKIIGTVTSIQYGSTITWIGMMLVDPEYRRQGIGTELMETLLHSCRKKTRSIWLDATSDGKNLYAQLGFQPLYRINRLILDESGRQPYSPPEATENLAALSEDMIWYDAIVFGANRRNILSFIQNQNPHLVKNAWRKGKLVGFCMGREGRQSTQIGPVIAKEDEVAKQLVQSGIQQTHKTSVILDVPEEHFGWTDWLLAAGFSVKRSFTRMVLGMPENTQFSRELYAIAGPEIG